MPRGDGTGPDGKGPKKENKGWPRRYGPAARLERRRNAEKQNDKSDKKE